MIAAILLFFVGLGVMAWAVVIHRDATGVFQQTYCVVMLGVGVVFLCAGLVVEQIARLRSDLAKSTKAIVNAIAKGRE